MYKYKYLLNVTQDVEHSLQTLFQVFSNEGLHSLW